MGPQPIKRVDLNLFPTGNANARRFGKKFRTRAEHCRRSENPHVARAQPRQPTRFQCEYKTLGAQLDTRGLKTTDPAFRDRLRICAPRRGAAGPSKVVNLKGESLFGLHTPPSFPLLPGLGRSAWISQKHAFFRPRQKIGFEPCAAQNFALRKPFPLGPKTRGNFAQKHPTGVS